MRSRHDSGFTLLEICVAIAIFAIGILTSLSVLVPAVRWGAEAKNDFSAAEAALSAAEFLQAGGDLTSTNKFYLGPNRPTLGNNSIIGKNFFPFAVESDKAKLGANPEDVTLTVYRRLFEPNDTNGNGSVHFFDDTDGTIAALKTSGTLINSGGVPTEIFKIKLKLYRKQ